MTKAYLVCESDIQGILVRNHINRAHRIPVPWRIDLVLIRSVAAARTSSLIGTLYSWSPFTIHVLFFNDGSISMHATISFLALRCFDESRRCSVVDPRPFKRAVCIASIASRKLAVGASGFARPLLTRSITLSAVSCNKQCNQ